MLTAVAHVLAFVATAQANPPPPMHPDAASACAAMNTSMLIEVMHGFGQIDEYSRKWVLTHTHTHTLSLSLSLSRSASLALSVSVCLNSFPSVHLLIYQHSMHTT